jgi:hypothetical protein
MKKRNKKDKIAETNIVEKAMTEGFTIKLHLSPSVLKLLYLEGAVPIILMYDKSTNDLKFTVVEEES